ncbi:MAG TPA: guanylate kinase [Phycisphaerae bacterium]|nr:guanylate kinase [Phycisphaerae bacterium]
MPDPMLTPPPTPLPPLPGLLIFVSGPSGVGKSTVCRRLTTVLPADFALSATTRAGKPQDVHGKRYQFVSEPEFRRRLEAGEFLEYAYVFGNWYGTLRTPVEEGLAAGQTILLEIDVQGAIQVHQLFPHAMGVFILPPSEEDLLKRLRERGRDDEATILRRFTEAKQEIRTAEASGVYDLLVINEDQGVEKTVDAIRRAVRKFRGGATLFDTE